MSNFQAEFLVYCSSMGSPGEIRGQSPGKGNRGNAGKGYQGKNPFWIHQPSIQYPGNQITGEESLMILPSPEEIEKLMCNLASSDMVEKEATEEVCKLIKEHFSTVKMQPDCEMGVSALWDKIKAQCSKGKDSFMALPTPEEIEKLVCKLASSETVEKEATVKVCKLIKEQFPLLKMQPDCEIVVSALWDKIKVQCPKDKHSFLASPSLEDIEKLVCKLASSELVEKVATEEVCKLIKEHIPSVKMQSECETTVSALWDKIKARYPKGTESLLASPCPEDIEKLVYNLVSSELGEKEATEEVCKLVKEDFPSVKMQPDCATVVSALWDKFKARCLKDKESLLAWSSPEDIVKLVCKIASFELAEKEAIEEVCKLIKENFPSAKMQPDCETVVSTLWSKYGAIGPILDWVTSQTQDSEDSWQKSEMQEAIATTVQQMTGIDRHNIEKDKEKKQNNDGKDSRGFVQGGLKAVRKVFCLNYDFSSSEDSSSSNKKKKKKKLSEKERNSLGSRKRPKFDSSDSEPDWLRSLQKEAKETEKEKEKEKDKEKKRSRKYKGKASGLISSPRMLPEENVIPADKDQKSALTWEQKVQIRTKLSVGDKVTDEQLEEEWDAHFSAAACQQDLKAIASACQVNWNGSKMEILVRIVDWYKVFADFGSKVLCGSGDIQAEPMIPFKSSSPLVVRFQRAEGGSYSHFYLGKLSIGNTEPQELQVLFDIASGHVLLPHQLCRSKACKDHHRYFPEKSGTAMDTNTDGKPFQQGQHLAKGKVTWEFLFLRSFAIFFRAFGATTGYHIFRFPCHTSATCQNTLVIVGLVMQEIMIAILNLMQMMMKFKRLWSYKVLATYLPTLSFQHTCDILDALLPVALTGWNRHVLVIGVVTALTYFGYILLFRYCLGWIQQHYGSLIGTCIWDLYVPTHLCRPRRVPRFSGSSAFISLHLFQGIEAKLSMIWHIVSAVQLSIRFFLVHPNSSCVIAGWTWTIAETWHIVSAMQLILRIFLIHPISCCVIAGWAWIVAETVL